MQTPSVLSQNRPTAGFNTEPARPAASTKQAAESQQAAAASGSSGSSSSSSSSASSTITANDFLTLLVAEMKNQDPTSQQDPNAYINQLVQVNSLQQLIQINQDLGSGSTATGNTPTGSVAARQFSGPAVGSAGAAGAAAMPANHPGSAQPASSPLDKATSVPTPASCGPSRASSAINAASRLAVALAPPRTVTGSRFGSKGTASFEFQPRR